MRTHEHDPNMMTPPLSGIFLSTKLLKIWPELCFLFVLKMP